METKQTKEVWEKDHGRFVREWSEFLSIPSISTDPAFQEECIRCANWLKSHIDSLGFATELWDTKTKPVLFAERKGNPNKPVVLFYGHYDVQPVDPEDAWTSKPFEPTLRDGRMYARGAQDNKGQVFFYLKALEHLIQSKADLPTIKLLIEGEEETASEGLSAGLEGWAPRLKADVLMVCDTATLAPGISTITMGLRGIGSLEFKVTGANTDLHSGVYGGVVPNPIDAVAKLLASLHNEDGSIAVAGFYDGMKEPQAVDAERAIKLPIPLSVLEDKIGAKFTGGEMGLHPLIRRAFRPTIEPNGIGGGYQGAGGKTVIPSSAFAKLSMRLVAGQDPAAVVEKITAHLNRRVPEGLKLEIVNSAAVGGSLMLSSSAKFVTHAARSIKEAFDSEPLLMWEGASIPIIPRLAEASGAEPILVGYGLDEDRIHAPNESFALTQLRDGFIFVSQFLGSL